MDFVIREAREAELALLPAIEQAAAQLFAPWGLDTLFSSATTPIDRLREARAEARLIVAAIDDRAIGFALFSLVDGHLHLDELDVDPAYGRRGIGRAILEAVVARTCSLGLARLTLATMREVPFNGPWYQRLGFRELEERELGPGLRSILRRELAGGYPIAARVILGLDL